MEGENEYACNVCNEGFYRDDEIKNHITSNHKEVFLQNSKNINEEDNESDESFDDAWLAKFDNDKNRIK